MAGLPRFRIHDPDFINLRKSLRAAIIAPVIFVVADFGFDQTLVGVFGFLSAFCALVFADVGGPIRARGIALLIMLVFTNLSVIAGSLLVDTTIVAGLVMAAITFTVIFAGVVSVYAASFVAPVALAFAFAVFVPLETIGLLDRVIGWGIGGFTAAVAVVVLWPVDSRADIREALAAAAANLADALAKRNGEGAAAAMKRAAAALASAQAKASAPLRPARIAAHDIGLLNLLDGLDGAFKLTEDVLSARLSPEDSDLVTQVVDALRRTETALTGRTAPQSVVGAIGDLDRSLTARRKVAAEAATRLAVDREADLVAEFSAVFPLLALCHVTLWIEADAAEALGVGNRVHPVASAPELSGEMGDASNAFLRLRGTVRTYLDPSGVVFRNSLRGAAAMGLGVVVAKFAPLDHGFWIVLGVLSVLRSSAASTSATALWAIAGTTVGFVLSAALLLSTAGDTSLLWWVMPGLVFLAGYAPGAIGFSIGQAAFTVMVVCLFDIIDPKGVSTALVRLEAVSIGAISAAIVALILWPRGARAALARSAAAVYRTAADGLRIVLTAKPAERKAAAERLEAAIEESTAAFSAALGERGERIDTQAWTALGRAPGLVHSFLGGLVPAYPATPPPGCTAAADANSSDTEAMADRMAAIADRLESPDAKALSKPPPAPHSHPSGLNDCLCTTARSDRADVGEALAIMAWSEWLTRLDQAIQAGDAAQASVAGAASRTRWLSWSLHPTRRHTAMADTRQ
ncbi:FUSC family protein [Bauldia sp.]|uniref:FUSC family protein n=1 Tax=Bauldia sp. TaxID=2575872 RepID=UPI003BABE6C6